MTSSVIVTIVVILGIIIAGGFLLYFMGDLLMSMSNKNKDNEAIKNNQARESKALEERVKALENSEEAKNDPVIATILYNGGVVESYNPDEEEKVENEEETVEETVETEETPVEETTEEQVEETPVEETVEEVAEETAEEETEEDDDTSEFIRKRRLELMERLVRMQEAEQEENYEEEAVDVSEEETTETAETEETVEEAAEEQVEKTPVEEAAEEITETETVEETPVDTVVVDAKFEEAEAENTLASTMTLEELEAKLASEQDRLKANEKELRQCKKDYLPLRRVKKTLENDEKKLRRKEALVAKQKVVLYGVNNYADIDEEKAKKLAEDLDLLDGLKLSVQHCQEVMDKNEERYPLLEKIYNLLTSQNEEIKGNVKQLQDAIEELKAQADSDTTDTTTDAE